MLGLVTCKTCTVREYNQSCLLNLVLTSYRAFYRDSEWFIRRSWGVVLWLRCRMLWRKGRQTRFSRYASWGRTIAPSSWPGHTRRTLSICGTWSTSFFQLHMSYIQNRSLKVSLKRKQKHCVTFCLISFSFFYYNDHSVCINSQHNHILVIFFCHNWMVLT